MTRVLEFISFVRVKQKIGRPKKSGPPRAKVTLMIDAHRWADLRIHAIKVKSTASDIIGNLVEEYLKKEKKKGSD